MATCEYFLELLSAGLDGELTADEERELAEHLATCRECRTLAPRVAAAHAAFPQLEEIPAPEGFAAGVMARIRAEEKSKTKVIPLFRRPQFRAAAGLAACAVLCVGLYRVMPGVSRSDSAESMAVSAEATRGVKDAAYDMFAAPEAEAPMAAAPQYEAVLDLSGVRYFDLTWREDLNAPVVRVLEDGSVLPALLDELGYDRAEVQNITDLAPEMGGPMVAVVLTEPSGSIRHAVESVADGAVVIRRDVPEVGTDDMAAQLILVPVDEVPKTAPEVILLEERK